MFYKSPELYEVVLRFPLTPLDDLLGMTHCWKALLWKK